MPGRLSTRRTGTLSARLYVWTAIRENEQLLVFGHRYSMPVAPACSLSVGKRRPIPACYRRSRTLSRAFVCTHCFESATTKRLRAVDGCARVASSVRRLNADGARHMV